MPTAAPLDLVASIRGRRALVTGGSVGIGRNCVESLLAHGATVAFTYNRHVEEARSLAAAHPGRASCHFLDLRDPKSIVACFDEFQRRWGQLDVLVNNAAVGTATVAQYEPDPLRKDRALFEINAMGSFEVAQNGLRLMKAQAAGGPPRKLINISSVGGLQVFPSMRLADNMSKAAIVYMTRQLAAELVHEPIDVFGVCPGATDTEMFRSSTLKGMNEKEERRFCSRLPKGRLIRPEEVAEVVVFLASGYSTVMHGSVLDLSMGLGVHPGLLTGAP